MTPRYPTLTDYLEAMANPDGRFRTLTRCTPLLDRTGGPRYRSARGRIVFAVLLGEQRGELTCFLSAEAAARRPDALPGEIYVFDRSGRGTYYPAAYRAATPADSAPGLRAAEAQGLFGYLDSAGRWAIAPAFKWAGDFGEGRAAVQNQQGMMGLIDDTGKPMIPCEYDDLSWDGSRFAYVEYEGRWGCLGREGETVVPLQYDWMGEFSEGWAVVQQQGRHGFVNQRGELHPAGLCYDNAWSLSGGVAQVVRDGVREVVRFD